jgi:hypothetical protein
VRVFTYHRHGFFIRQIQFLPDDQGTKGYSAVNGWIACLFTSKNFGVLLFYQIPGDDLSHFDPAVTLKNTSAMETTWPVMERQLFGAFLDHDISPSARILAVF